MTVEYFDNTENYKDEIWGSREVEVVTPSNSTPFNVATMLAMTCFSCCGHIFHWEDPVPMVQFRLDLVIIQVEVTMEGTDH